VPPNIKKNIPEEMKGVDLIGGWLSRGLSKQKKIHPIACNMKGSSKKNQPTGEYVAEDIGFPSDPAQERWLTMLAEIERDFPNLREKRQLQGASAIVA